MFAYKILCQSAGGRKVLWLARADIVTILWSFPAERGGGATGSFCTAVMRLLRRLERNTRKRQTLSAGPEEAQEIEREKFSLIFDFTQRGGKDDVVCSV